MLIDRPRHIVRLTRSLRRNRAVLLLGARQVGKSTLARMVAGVWKGRTAHFDLEDARDRRRLEDPYLGLEKLTGLVVLDEVQHAPDLFPALRVLIDRPRSARFLLLGSASPELLRQGSESLAGRVALHHLGGFELEETGIDATSKLWLRGGFPRSFLAPSGIASLEWRRDFIATFLARDLPQLGVSLPARTMERLWTMLAHNHGQLLNASEIGASLGVSHTTVRKYIDLLRATFVIRELRPWSENVGKRVVKSPRLYVADSGLLHALLDLPDMRSLERHPKLGASWEGFALDSVVNRLRADEQQCFFWRTHAGAELDLLVVHGSKRLGFEFKRTSAPQLTKSMRSALETLNLDRLRVVHAGSESYRMAKRVDALSIEDILDDLKPLRS